MVKIYKLALFLTAICQAAEIPSSLESPTTAAESSLTETPNTSESLSFWHKKLEVYNHNQHEIHQFIEKIRQTKTPIRNDLEHPVTIKVTMLRNGISYKEKQTLGAKETLILAKESICQAVKIYDSKAFINLEQGPKKYTIVLSHQEIPYRPYFIEHADFKPVFLKPQTDKNPLFFPYSPVYHAVNLPTNLSLSFQEQYDGNLRYITDCQFRHEEIDSNEYYERLNQLYKTNYFPNLYNQLVRENKHISLENPKIPGLIHTIWLTHKEHPIEFPEEFAQYTLDSLKACPPEQGYEHILWVKSKKKLPHTVKRFNNTGVKLKEYKKLGQFDLKSKLKEEISKKRFGRASDILRIEILERFGGVYRDTDYRIHQSLTPLLMSYDFIGAREPMSSFVCNAFIAASPNHPVIRTYKSLIQRNYNSTLAPDYIRRVPETDGFSTILVTGPGAFTTAVAKAIGQSNRRDVILPHQYIYPTPIDTYPQLIVIKPGNSVPRAAFGTHYWLSSWTTLSTFGSKG